MTQSSEVIRTEISLFMSHICSCRYTKSAQIRRLPLLLTRASFTSVLIHSNILGHDSSNTHFMLENERGEQRVSFYHLIMKIKVELGNNDGNMLKLFSIIELFLLFEAKKWCRNCSLQKHIRGWSFFSFVNTVQSHPVGEGNSVSFQ